MKRQEKMLAKKRGRPATGRGQTVGVRCHDDLIASIDAWAAQQDDAPTRPEAIRRLTTAMLQILDKDPGEKSARAKKR
jgi:hypothetical protein